MSDPLSVDDFAAHRGDAFRIGGDGGHAVQCTLVSVTAHGQAVPVPGGRAGFSLLFSGPAEAPLQQGLHRVVHPARGALDIFLVPVGRDAATLQYEAVFN